jgi:hypothetical protein
MGKKRGVHTAVVLPPEVLDQLRKSERAVSEEIRRRIARTFEQDAADPVMRELCNGISRIADKLRQDFGADWHASPRAHQAFVAAVAQRIAQYTPPTGTESAARSDLVGTVGVDDPPETIGRLRERDDRRRHQLPYSSVHTTKVKLLPGGVVKTAT